MFKMIMTLWALNEISGLKKQKSNHETSGGCSTGCLMFILYGLVIFVALFGAIKGWW